MKRKFICELRVVLRDIKPSIWRRIHVPDDINLFELHNILQIVMGWEDYHLHSFHVGETLYGNPALLEEIPVRDEKKARLNRVAPNAGSQFIYEYDFGDYWIHEIYVEGILESASHLRHPICVAGARACPPEDCGGYPGYEDFIKAIKNLRHPEHESMLLWAGGSFDPEAFDLEAINKRLRISF